MPPQYDIEEHRHRFAVWAAARAAQRGFTNVEKLRGALESCGVRDFLKTCGLDAIDEQAFEVHHRKWCSDIVRSLTDAGVKNVTYGRAAKLIAIYLKSVIVLGVGCGSKFSRVAHPPIDSILLSNVAALADVNPKHNAGWAKLRWTNLDETSYYRLIGELRAIAPGEPFWMLERYWTVTDGEG